MELTDADTGAVQIDPDTPSVLYHYTGSSGLQGILEGGGIWATEMRYLNDEREMQHGLEMLIPEFVKRVEALDDRKLIRGIAEVVTTHRIRTSHFVSCFCADGDLLSQWRAYGTPGGYALGFSAGIGSAWGIDRRVDAPVRVRYADSETKALVAEFANRAADELVETFAPNHDAIQADAAAGGERELLVNLLHAYGDGYMSQLEHFCAQLKDASFAEEREWRIIHAANPFGGRQSDIRFRQGPFGVTPYIFIDLREPSGLLPLSEIVVGPGSNAALRADAVMMLLSRMGYEPGSVLVRKSATPYRP